MSRRSSGEMAKPVVHSDYGRCDRAACPTESHLSRGIPLNPTYPTESHLSRSIPLNPAYPTESHSSHGIPPSPAEFRIEFSPGVSHLAFLKYGKDAPCPAAEAR